VRIDAHHHLWRLERGYDFPSPDLAPIYRDFTVGDLAPHLAARGIAATILVQVAEDVAETSELLEIARDTPSIAGVVGWLDLEAADAADAIAKLAADPLLVGLRPMVQGMADDGWLSRVSLDPAFAAMARHGLVLDGLAKPRHLPGLISVADRHPELAIVLDHGGKPDIRARLFEPWGGDIGELARRPNVACKLSGLVTEADEAWSVGDLRPYADHLVRAFGPERLMWGSDWPVVNLAGGYEAWCAATDHLIEGLADEDRDAVLGGTAARVYLAERGRR
jgi:L-fucono-1,5-lactonase